MKIEDYVVDVPDFPKTGIQFKDITPILNEPSVFQSVINQMGDFVQKIGANVIVAPEARGFVFAAPIAYKLGLRLVLVRKPGKLPRAVHDVSYDLEYGQNHLQVQQGDLKVGDQIVVIDDVLATGGTIHAIQKLAVLEKATVVGVSVVLDLTQLHEKNPFGRIAFQTLIQN